MLIVRVKSLKLKYPDIFFIKLNKTTRNHPGKDTEILAAFLNSPRENTLNGLPMMMSALPNT
jgi:hypothetical protein